MIWKIKNRSINFTDAMPLVMGVLNITPDSFSDGGRHLVPADAVASGIKMLEEGADILDVGGESTRPGAEAISADVEQKRILPVIEGLRREAPEALISIDTYKAETARRALDAGADIVNDVSGFDMDPGLLDVLKVSDCGYILMHIKGTPRNMQNDPHYDDVVTEIISYLCEKLNALKKMGIDRERVCVDPGIGFGKRMKDNLDLIARTDKIIEETGRPLLLGPSRKRYMGDLLGLPVEERLEATLASLSIGVWLGASVLRVHDVREARRAADMTIALRRRCEH